ncbi:MAG: hypothetical protein P4L22_06115 [Candidatus Babeliales bacterium]|nr:hypothetical protein [Candidatus Babeliales bacterium]
MKKLLGVYMVLGLMVMPMFSSEPACGASKSLVASVNTAISKSGLLTAIQNHINKNKLAYCVATVATVGVGAYGLYCKYYIAPDESTLKNDDEFISPDGKSHGLKIPELKHLALAGGPDHCIGTSGGQPELDDLIEYDSWIDLMQEERYTKRTFKELILQAETNNKPYLLVRLAFFHTPSRAKVGYRSKSFTKILGGHPGQDIPQIIFLDGEGYQNDENRDSKAKPYEDIYIQITHKNGKFQAKVIKNASQCEYQK